MKARNSLSMVALVLAWSGVTLAQDPVKVDSAHYKVLLENPTVRVLKIEYAAGAKSVMHQHPDAIVVPLVASKVRFAMPDGTSQEMDLGSESALYTPAGTHSPENVGTGPVDAILVEFKSAAPGKAEVPTTRAGMGIKVLAEGPYGMAERITADATFEEPAGSKHDYDQVVVTLGPSQMSLTIDGKPSKTTWSRGEVQFIGRGVPHQGKNVGGKPVDYVIIAIK
jgi:quercetin dioxygenase-like cupin family protein